MQAKLLKKGRLQGQNKVSLKKMFIMYHILYFKKIFVLLAYWKKYIATSWKYNKQL